MTAHAPLSAFDRDTALEPAGDGRWRAAVPGTWLVGTGPNGGFLAAVATRAMIAAAEGREPRSLTLHYLRPPAVGDVDVACTVERAGRTTTFLSLRITQAGVTVALGVGACADWRDGSPEWDDARAPAVPPPGQVAQVPVHARGAPPFWSNYEVRPVTGELFGGSEGRAAGWIRPAEPRPVDAALLAALTDAWVPAAFMRLREPVPVPTIDLTIHWRGRTEGVAGHAWVLGEFTTATAAGGVWEEDGRLWSEDGDLLAQSRQLAILRRPR